MGVRRYSKNSDIERWERRFDELQSLCHQYDYSPTIGELIDHGITTAYWACRSVGWRDDGKPSCGHTSEKTPMDLQKFGRNLTVSKLRWKYVCSSCGRKRPYIQLIAE